MLCSRHKGSQSIKSASLWSEMIRSKSESKGNEIGNSDTCHHPSGHPGQSKRTRVEFPSTQRLEALSQWLRHVKVLIKKLILGSNPKHSDLMSLAWQT